MDCPAFVHAQHTQELKRQAVHIIRQATSTPCHALQVRITRGKLASGSSIPRPALLAKSSRTRSYVGELQFPSWPKLFSTV